jgi:hypothetical protein
MYGICGWNYFGQLSSVNGAANGKPAARVAVFAAGFAVSWTA